MYRTVNAVTELQETVFFMQVASPNFVTLASEIHLQGVNGRVLTD